MRLDRIALPMVLLRIAFRVDIGALQDTLTLLDEGTLLRAVDTILCAKHVFLIGFGTSAPVSKMLINAF